MKPMNPEIKEEWCRRLRDPDLEQAFGVLSIERDGAMQCCAYGVLCEIAAAAGIVGRTVVEDVGKWPTVFYYPPDDIEDRRNANPPKVVLEWAGLLDSNDNTPRFAWREAFGRFLGEDSTYGIGCLNDDLGLSLDSIADVIEEEL